MKAPPKMLDIPTQKKLAELSMQVQETSRHIANQRITPEEIEELFKDLTVHFIELHKIYLHIKEQ